MISYVAPVYGTYLVQITASYASYGSYSVTFKLQCLYPLKILFANATVYYGSTFTQAIKVTRNNAAVSSSSFQNVWIAGDKPSTMSINSSLVVSWVVDYTSNQTLTLDIYVKDTNNPSHSATNTSLLTVIYSAVPVFSISEVPSSLIYCTLNPNSPRSTCYLTDLIANILPAICTGGCTYLLSTTASVTLSPSGNITWNRTNITTENLNATSTSVTVIINDANKVQASATPFYFTPVFIANISGLLFANSYPGEYLYYAYTNCIWQREFMVYDWTTIYPLSTDIDDSQLSLTGLSGITFNRGILEWYPSTSGDYTLIISYTDTSSSVFSRSFSIRVYDINPPICSFSQPGILYTNIQINIDLNWNCTNISSPIDGSIYTNSFEISSLPSGCSFNSGIINWIATTSGIYSFNISAWSYEIYNYEVYNYELIIQEPLSISIGSASCTYGQDFKTQFTRGSSCLNMPMSMLTFSLVWSSSTTVITLSSIGDFEWAFPNSNLKITVELSLDGTYYYAESVEENFTITITDQNILLSISPMSDSYKTVLINNYWTMSATCSINQGSVNISSTSVLNPSYPNSNDLTTIEYSWMPTYTSCSPELVMATCTSSKSTVSYYFTVLPEFPSTDTPSCTDFAITGYRGILISGYIPWTTNLFNFDQFNITCDYMLGLICYHYGYYEWLPSDDPLIYTVWIYINGTKSCLMSVTYLSKPLLSEFSPIYCDSPCIINVDIDVKGTYPISFSINDTSNEFIIYTNNNSITWIPSAFTAYKYISLTANNIYGSDTTSLFFCQGVACRYNPVIVSITADKNCNSLENGVNCSIFIPENITLTINGRHFGNYLPILYIGEFLVNIITYNNIQITCFLPYPNFGSYENMIVYIKNTQTNKYSIGYQLISYTYPFIPIISSIENYYIMEESGLITVQILNNLVLLPVCDCIIQLITGVFVYNGDNSWCVFSSSDFDASKVYNLQVCCFGSCSNSISFNVYKHINIATNISTGHNHGGYTIKVSVTYLGTCVEDSVIFKFGNIIIKPYSSCADFNTNGYYILNIPMQANCRLITEAISVSLNFGLDFTQGINPQQFRFTGCCSLGTYINNNLCSPCPKGYYCNVNAVSPNSIFISPIPCDLGYYSNSVGASECTLCPPGYQCYCRGIINPIECDAGFICKDYGTTKRRTPCPSGRYCQPGMNNTNSSNYPGYAPKCDAGTYCIHGIYTNAVADEKYHAHNCKANYTCAPGSTNELGATDCDVGYFCPAPGSDTSAYNCTGLLCECPPGFSCPTGQLKAPIQCNIGEYQSFSRSQACITCPEGYYCPFTPYQITAVPCPAGSYCPIASIGSTLCSLGYYQPAEKNGSCIPCPPGTYQNSMGSINCIPCPAGSMCPLYNQTSLFQCPQGYFCLTNTNKNITGTCQNITGTSDIYPIACPMYNYCPGGSSSPKICNVGTFSYNICTVACNNCSDGYLCMGDGKEIICPIGFYCYNNRQYSCPAGYYCLNGTSTSDPNSLLASRPLACMPGTYCSGGNTDGNATSGVLNSAQYCSKGTYNNLWAMGSCLACLPGYECTSTGTILPIICQQGTYRPNDTKILNCVNCPEGTYNTKTGSFNSSDCIDCDAGTVCIGMKMAYPNSTNSKNCSAGYYCLAGTGSGTASKNPCPAGIYCFEGTKSLNDAKGNICPAGRYCAIGTGATLADATLCNKNFANCQIGSSCSQKFYCPAGTKEMLACPAWTTSNSGSSMLNQCYRSSTLPDFYQVTIVKEVPAMEPIILNPFSYSELTVDFLQYYHNALMPIDYQFVLKITPVSKLRRLTDQTTRILIITNDNYGTKQSLPLPFAQTTLFEKSDAMTIAINTNIQAEVSFALQFLNGSYFSIEAHLENITSNPTMSIKTSYTFDSGFLAFITSNIGSIFEDPINYYNISTVDNSSYLLENRHYENRFFSTVITNDSIPSWTDFSNLQNTTSIWNSRTSPILLSYIPYIAECYPGYGSMIPLNVLLHDSRCKIEANPNPIGYLSFFGNVKGNTCNFAMACMYDLDLSSLNRAKRWYEANTCSDNLKTTTKDLKPPLYLTKQAISGNDLSEMMNDAQLNLELIPVIASRKLTESWSSGQFPQTISFNIQYHFKDMNDLAILQASVEFSDFSTNASASAYQLYFTFTPLTWLECFNLKSFATTEYLLLLLMIISSQISAYLLSFTLSFFIKPATRKLRGMLIGISLAVNCLKGFLLMIIPIILVLSTMISIIYYENYFKFISANFTDTTVITDVNSTKVILYMDSRIGIILMVSGLLLIKWGSNLIVPTTAYFGYSYETQKQQYKVIQELPKKQGFVMSSAIGIAIASIILDSIGQLPVFQIYYFLIFPIILISEFFAKIYMLKYFENELETLPARIGIKIGIFIMLLNIYEFHLMILLYTIWMSWNFFYGAFIEKYSQIYIFEYIIKSIEKRDINENNMKKHNLIYAISELSERSLNVLMCFITPMITGYVYILYDLYQYRLDSIYILYFLLYQLVVLVFEPFKEMIINFIRITRDYNYRVPEVFEYSLINYRQRLTKWALSFIKIHDETLNIPFIEQDVFMIAWSSQLFFSLTPFAVGIFLISHACKMWEISKNSPFMDYWMCFFGVCTLITAILIKKIGLKIADSLLWKISSLNQLHIVGVDGKAISSREKYIDDIILKQKLEGEDAKDSKTYFIAEFSEELMQIIKDNDDNTLIKRHLAKALKEKHIYEQINSQKIFEDIRNRIDGLNQQKLEERIQNVIDPLTKIFLVNAKMIKNSEKYSRYPLELVYNW